MRNTRSVLRVCLLRIAAIVRERASLTSVKPPVGSLSLSRRSTRWVIAKRQLSQATAGQSLDFGTASSSADLTVSYPFAAAAARDQGQNT
jgi:hypothetical protein